MDAAQELEVKQLEASVLEARSKGQEPRALALEARIVRVRTGPRLSPEPPPFIDAASEARAEIARSRKSLPQL